MEQRFILSGGAIFGKVKQLESGYQAIRDRDINPSTVNDPNLYYKNLTNSGVPLIDKWASSFFIGVSYNLGTIAGGSRRTIVAR